MFDSPRYISIVLLVNSQGFVSRKFVSRSRHLMHRHSRHKIRRWCYWQKHF